ncbi:MAG: NUDIX domain-containing protein [Candidatus Aenigmarchaeota archaeon]|nr:NUDIX domain-containing protein [Candidatus Aenigmarchaeota archaeon]
MTMRKVVVGVIFTREKNVKFLVLYRKLGWHGWEFPKGGIEKQDLTEEHALKREIKEETSLENIRILDKLPYTIKYFYPKAYKNNYKHEGTEQAVFLVRAFSTDIKLSTEHGRYKWLAYEKARAALKWPNQRKALDIAWKQIKEMDKIPKDVKYITS